MKKIKKHYRIRPYSPIWWMGVTGMFAVMFVMCGLLTSWDLGLL